MSPGSVHVSDLVSHEVSSLCPGYTTSCGRMTFLGMLDHFENVRRVETASKRGNEAKE